MTLIFSPSSTDSWSTLSKLPSELVGTAFVLETGDSGCLGFGSLAGTGLSVLRRIVEGWNARLEAKRRPARTRGRDSGSMMTVSVRCVWMDGS